MQILNFFDHSVTQPFVEPFFDAFVDFRTGAQGSENQIFRIGEGASVYGAGLRCAFDFKPPGETVRVFRFAVFECVGCGGL